MGQSTSGNSNWPTLIDLENCLCGVSGTVLEYTSSSFQTPALENNASITTSISVDIDAVTCFSWRLTDQFSSSTLPPTTVCNSSSSLPFESCPTTVSSIHPPRSHAHQIEDVLYQRVVVAIACFGLIGNVVNITVLAAAGRRQNLGGLSSTRIQRFARLGLMALAVADSSFCLAIIPHAFVERDPFRPSIEFSLLYAAYADAFINWFAMSGTWLTVSMAVGRYAAVCHPFRARAAIGRKVALQAIALVFIVCLIANVPRFLRYTVESVRCPQSPVDENSTIANWTIEYYFRWHGLLHARRNLHLELAYVWLYFIVAVAAPLIVLLYTGCRLGFRLRRSRRDAVERDMLSGGGGGTAATSEAIDRPFTVTLVAVAAMHVILVSPAELLNFTRQHLLFDTSRDNAMTVSNSNTSVEAYNLLATVLNTLQAANYSLNFLLYCAVNVAFRRRFVELVGCRLPNGAGLVGGPESADNRIRLQMLLNTGALVDVSTFSSRSNRRIMKRSTSDRGSNSDRETRVSRGSRRIGYTPAPTDTDCESFYCGVRGSPSPSEAIELQLSADEHR